jgi:HEAT repeat protein
LEYVYLNGATWVLGEMKEQQATFPLSQMLFDKKVHENIRALAARSLGQIDADGNKQLLLRALGNVNDYYIIRVYAAEALAKINDPQALKALEQYSRQERDAHVRQKFENAAREIRGRITRPR